MREAVRALEVVGGAGGWGLRGLLLGLRDLWLLGLVVVVLLVMSRFLERRRSGRHLGVCV